MVWGWRSGVSVSMRVWVCRRSERSSVGSMFWGLCLRVAQVFSSWCQMFIVLSSW